MSSKPVPYLLKISCRVSPNLSLALRKVTMFTWEPNTVATLTVQPVQHLQQRPPKQNPTSVLWTNFSNLIQPQRTTLGLSFKQTCTAQPQVQQKQAERAARASSRMHTCHRGGLGGLASPDAGGNEANQLMSACSCIYPFIWPVWVGKALQSRQQWAESLTLA